MDALSLTFLVVCCALVYVFLTRFNDYWNSRNVPFIPPVLVWGNLKPLLFLEKSPGPFLGDLYNAKEALGQPFVGIFLLGCRPALLIRDPKIIKRVLVQDFDHFHNRNVKCNAGVDPIGVKNLFVVRDAEWKYLRTRLSPIFTSGKMKQMFFLIRDIANQLCTVIEGRQTDCITVPGDNSVLINCKELIAKYTTDVINACAFGINSHSLSDPNSQFRYYGKKVFNTSRRRALETRSFFFMHSLSETFRFMFLEGESTKFMVRVFSEILAEREKSLVTRNDFIDVLIKLKKDLENVDSNNSNTSSSSRKPRNLNEVEETVIAQASLFYIAGFETTSLTVMWTLYELALQPDLQERLRAEILLKLKESNGDIDYESLFQMKYLDMVVSETLRKYPPMPFIDRTCTKDYTLSDFNLTIEKGTPVFISLYKGLHYDESYFPNPEKYDPDRFSDERKAELQSYTYMPFGEGPHICIGMRFGLMNAKIAISLLLSNFIVEICNETQIPMEICPRTIILNSARDLYLKFIPLQATSKDV